MGFQVFSHLPLFRGVLFAFAGSIRTAPQPRAPRAHRAAPPPLPHDELGTSARNACWEGAQGHNLKTLSDTFLNGAISQRKGARASAPVQVATKMVKVKVTFRMQFFFGTPPKRDVASKCTAMSSRAAGGNAKGSAGATSKPLSAVVQEEVPAWQRPPNRQSDTRLRGRTESYRRSPPASLVAKPRCGASSVRLPLRLLTVTHSKCIKNSYHRGDFTEAYKYLMNECRAPRMFHQGESVFY